MLAFDSGLHEKCLQMKQSIDNSEAEQHESPSLAKPTTMHATSIQRGNTNVVKQVYFDEISSRSGNIQQQQHQFTPQQQVRMQQPVGRYITAENRYQRSNTSNLQFPMSSQAQPQLQQHSGYSNYYQRMPPTQQTMSSLNFTPPVPIMQRMVRQIDSSRLNTPSQSGTNMTQIQSSFQTDNRSANSKIQRSKTMPSFKNN